jgi:hypothetical protein
VNDVDKYVYNSDIAEEFLCLFVSVCAHELASPDFFTFIDETEEDFHDVWIPVKTVWTKIWLAAIKTPHTEIF